MDDNTLIEEAVGIGVQQFAHEHPATYKVLVERLGDPVDFVIHSLERDVAYQALLEQTDKEVDIANVLKVLVPVMLKITEIGLGLL